MSFRIDQLAVLNLATVGNSITAGSFVKSGGTSSQFLKADGTVDTNAYITGITSGMVTTALGYTPVPNTRNITINGVTQDLSVDRTWTISAGVSSVTGSGSGISVSPTTGAVVISNTGVTSNVAGTGISVSGATGAVTITNTGVTSIVAGTAITISGATGAVTINNAGVTSVNGNTGAITGIITTSNYNSYSPTLTGGGASGTWGINVTGTAGSTQTLALIGLGNGSVNVNNGNTSVYRTENGSGAALAYAPVLHLGGGDTMWQAQGTYGASGNGTLYFRQGYAGSWGNWLTMLSSANYNSYSPTLTGTGASGTWGISISGNAATATNADTVDGFHASQSTVANNIVVRDANGYIFGNYINMTDDGNPGGGTAISSFITKQGDNYYRSVSPTNAMVSIRGVASGSWGINITGSAGSASSASSVPWTGVTAGTRTNYDLRFQPPSNSYAGFEFNTSTGGGAGYFLVKGTSDNDVYTAEGITLVADAGWLTLAQRTTSDKGVRIMTGSTSTTRMAFNANGTTYLYTDLYLGSTNTRITASDATGYLRIYGSSSNYLAIGPYNNNGWVYFENIANTNGMYFNSPGRYAFDSVDLTPYTDAENSLGNGSFRWSQVYTSGWLRQYGAQGMYNQDYGTHFYSNGGSSWGITGSGGNVELQFRSNHQSTIRGYVYADTGNNIGFLNNGGSWSLRTDSSRNTILYGQLTVGQDIGYSSIYMYDSDEGTREIHCNSNRIGFLTQAGSWGAYLDDGTNWYSEGNIYAVAATARIQAGNSSSNDILYDSSRSALVARGNYPHVEIFAEVSNNNHGGTLRYTGYDNGSSGAYKSWNIGTAGSDLYFLDIGYGGTSNPNPHAGIAGLGSAYGYPNAFTAMRFHNNGNVGIGDFGTYGSLGTNTPAYKLDVRGTIYSNTDMRAPIFYDSANTSYYCDPASTSVLNTISSYTIYNTSLGSGYYFTAGSWGWRHQTPSGYIEFGPANTGHAHIYTDRSNFYFNVDLLYLNGYIVPMYGYNRTGDLYASRYYDANDTSYYLDPASTSNLNKFSEFTMSYNDMNAMSVNSPYASRYAGSALYRNGTMGFGNTDFNVMFSNWGSGFIDSWSSPANAPGGSSHYVGLQGFHYNHVNNSQAYGFQMACAGEADNRFFWRSAWPNLRSWVEMIHSGNIGSQSVSYASSAGNADTVDGYHASTSTIGNYIVVRDGNGYIFGNYINMTDDGNPGGGTSITSFITKQGDNYYRSVSPTNAMASIRGVASGTWSISITGNAATVGGVSESQIVYGGAGRASNNVGNMNDTNQKSGLYYAYDPTGRPYAEWWNWITIAGNGWQSSNNYEFQLAHCFHDDGFYVRRMTNGTVYSWRYILTDSNSPYAYNMNQYVRTSDSPTFSSVYTSNWFRAYGDTGLYSQDYGSHIRRTVNASHGTWEIFGYSKGGYNGLNIYDPQGYINNYMHESGNGGLYQQNGYGWIFYWYRPNSCLGIGTSTTSGSYRMYVNGGIYATGDVVAYSDRRKKTDIITIDNALEKVTNLRGVFYTKIGEEEKGRKTGVIAQEINEVLPEVVTYAADVDEYGVSYGNIAGVLIEAIKEQNELIKTLKSEIDQLKAKLE